MDEKMRALFGTETNTNGARIPLLIM